MAQKIGDLFHTFLIRFFESIPFTFPTHIASYDLRESILERTLRYFAVQWL
jgi:hypothetical protein